MSDWERTASELDSAIDDLSYLRTDEFDDVLQNLDFVHETLANILEKPARWKWIILAMHNTLQGVCVCYLSGTAGVGALKKDSQRKTLEYFDREEAAQTEFPKQELAPLSQLLQRLPDGLRISINGIVAPYHFDLPGDVKRLQEMRDQFTHLAPTSWSIELAGLPRMIEHCLQLVEHVVSRPDFKTYNRFNELPIQERIDELRRELDALAKVLRQA